MASALIAAAKKTGCDVTLTDLPFDGLRIALGRAARDGLRGDCIAVVADAAELLSEALSGEPDPDRWLDLIDRLSECGIVETPGLRTALEELL